MAYDLYNYEAITAKMIEAYNEPDTQKALAVFDKAVREFFAKN